MTPNIERVDELISYHGAITRVMTAERTALGSQLIPVTAYILLSAAEAFWRWPEMLDSVATKMAPADIGAAGRHPGSRVNAVHLWSLANIYLTGRQFLRTLANIGLVPELDDPPTRTASLLGFWNEAARAYRADGHAQAWDGGFTVPAYEADVVGCLVDGASPLTDDERGPTGRFLATVTSYLFLLYFDTRVGTGDSGPYRLGDGRTLIARDFYWMGESDLPWSSVARDLPYQNLTAALVLDGGVGVRVNDWGTSITEPESYLDHVDAFGLFTTDGGGLRPVPRAELPDILAGARSAQAQHYRNIAAMSEAEKIDCGAYVYFTFLRPFAEVAGVADSFDWEVPRSTIGPLYDLITTTDWTMLPPDDGSQPYFAPYGVAT